MENLSADNAAKTETVSKTKLMMYLNDLMLTYAPVDVDKDGRVIGGDINLFMFVKGLMEEIGTW